MKIYTTPVYPAWSENIARDYFKQTEESMPKNMLYIGDGRNMSDVSRSREQIDLLKQTRMSKLKKWGFNPQQIVLNQYIKGNKKELFRKLSKFDSVFVDGGNTFDLAKFLKLTSIDCWIEYNRDNPDFIYMGYSSGVTALSGNLTGIENFDSPYTGRFGYELSAGLDNRSGLGITENTMIMQHKDSQSVAENGRMRGEMIDETIAIRNERGLQTIAVEDGKMFEWDLVTNEKNMISYPQDDQRKRNLRVEDYQI